MLLSISHIGHHRQPASTGYVYPPEDDTKCSVSLHTILPSTSDDPAIANYSGSTRWHAFSDSLAFMHTLPLISPPHLASWPIPTHSSRFSSSLTSSGNLALLGRITSCELVAPCSHLFHFTSIASRCLPSMSFWRRCHLPQHKIHRHRRNICWMNELK